MRKLLVALLLGTLIIACDSNDNQEDEIINQITFKAGQQRTYEEVDILVARDDDGNEIERTEQTRQFVVEVKAQSESLPGISGSIQVDQYAVANPDIIGSRWYTQSDSQLVEVAYRRVGAGSVTLKTISAQWVDPLLPSFDDALSQITPDEIILREVPRVVFDLPLEAGHSWVSLLTERFLITGTVLEKEEINVPAGRFNCQTFETEHQLDDNPSTIIKHYIDKEGLIKRVHTSEFPYRDSQNNPAGTATLVKTVQLIDLKG